jgi:hypothetical protein
MQGHFVFFLREAIRPRRFLMDKAKLMIIYADSDSFIGRGDKEEPTQAYFQYVEERDDEGNEVI